MSTDYNKPDTNCTLFINKIPRGKGIHSLTAMEQDASTAAAIRKLCVVVLKLRPPGNIRAGLQGTRCDRGLAIDAASHELWWNQRFDRSYRAFELMASAESAGGDERVRSCTEPC